MRTLSVVFGIVLMSCSGSGLPPKSNCEPETTRCHDGSPEVCSSTKRWTPANPEPCSSDEVCCEVDAGGIPTHICAPAAECEASR